MAYGVKALRKLQFGRETTSGTIAAATTIWRGEGVFEDTLVEIFPPEDIGYLSHVDRSYISLKGGKCAVASTPATFEQICHILEMGVKTASPVQDGAGSGYVRTYQLPTTAQNTIKTYTIENGDNTSAEVMEYCHVTDFQLDFKAGAALMMQCTIEGRQIAVQAFTGGVALPVVEEVLGSKGKLFIDAVGGTLGATQAANTVLSGSLKVKTGLVAVPTADGNLYFSFVKGIAPDATLDIVFEHEGTSDTEKVAWRAQTARKMRLLFVGNTLTTSGTTGGYTNKQLMIDVAGKWSKFGALTDQNGNDTIDGTFHIAYDATAALYCNLTVINELATLP